MHYVRLVCILNKFLISVPSEKFLKHFAEFLPAGLDQPPEIQLELLSARLRHRLRVGEELSRGERNGRNLVTVTGLHCEVKITKAAVAAHHAPTVVDGADSHLVLVVGLGAGPTLAVTPDADDFVFGV